MYSDDQYFQLPEEPDILQELEILWQQPQPQPPPELGDIFQEFDEQWQQREGYLTPPPSPHLF